MPFDTGTSLLEPVTKPAETWRSNAFALADFIESHPELPFDMREFFMPHCGTPGCIAGFAGTLWEDCRGGLQELECNSTAVAHKIGLKANQFNKLFAPGHKVPMRSITREEAVATLRHYAATGRVNWSAS